MQDLVRRVSKKSVKSWRADRRWLRLKAERSGWGGNVAAVASSLQSRGTFESRVDGHDIQHDGTLE